MDYLQKMQATYQNRPEQSIIKQLHCLWHDKSARVSLFAGEAKDFDLGLGIFLTLRGSVA